MSYQVLARKWRPQLFQDVVGQEMVTRTLQNAITSDRIAHAFLFSGVRGVGKTTTARILAKALNCLQGTTPTPCGKCDACREITQANSVDVMEIDAASNTGVDNIRDLRESVRYGTARDRFKIYIIDEVHMLSNAAFNALLKTLEEPPPHVKFIMATTELHKIPATIRSRCQQYDFKPISFMSILERLQLICREEGVEISEYGLRAVVAAAQGSMRDAQSALDQIIAFSGRKVEDQDVTTLLGIVGDRAAAELMQAVIERSREQVIQQMEVLNEDGVDPHVLSRRLIQHVRNLMVCRVAGWQERLLNLPDSEKDILTGQAEGLSELDLIRFYDVLNGAQNQLRWHPHPFLHLEMALVKLVELAHLPALEETISRLEGGVAIRPAEAEPALFSEAGASAAPESSPVARTPPAPETPPGGKKKNSPPKSRRPAPEEKATAEARQGPAQAGSSERRLMEAAQEESIRLASSLEHAASVELKEGSLAIVFSADDAFHQQVITEKENSERLCRLGEQITGAPVSLKVRVEDGSSQAEADPTDDPKVQAFIKTFPGKVVVKKMKE